MQQPSVSMLKFMQEQQNQARQMVQSYYSNPDAFTDDQIDVIANIAQQSGVPLEAKSSAGRKASITLANLLDSASFGLLPDSYIPTARTTGEKVAAGIGQGAGFLTGPLAAGKLISMVGANGVSKLIANKAGTLGKGLGNSLANGLGKVAEGAAKTGKFNFGKTKIADGVTQRLKNIGNLGDLLNTPGFQRGVSKAMTFGGANAAHGVFNGKGFDDVISDFFGGASIGVWGSIIKGLPQAEIRGIARTITAGIAGNSQTEEGIYQKLISVGASF